MWGESTPGLYALGAPGGQGVQEQPGHHVTAQERHQRGDEAEDLAMVDRTIENLQHALLPMVMKRDSAHLEHLL